MALVELVVVCWHVDRPSARLTRQQLMIGVASASVRGSDDVHAGPCTPVPYLEFRARREVLCRATLAQQGHDFGGSLHVDHAVVTNQKRRILTKRLVIE